MTSHRQLMAAAVRAIESDADFKAAAPSVHPLGFLRLHLPGHDPSKYRLHVWGALALEPQDRFLLVHDHNFGFISHCLVGTIRTRRWDLIETGVGSQQIYSVSYDAVGSMLTSSGLCSVSPAIWDVQEAGSSYAMNIGQFHEAEPLSTFVATVVEVTGNVAAPPRVVGPIDYPSPIRFERRGLSLCELLEAKAVMRACLLEK